MLIVFFGIGEEEKIIVFLGIIWIWWCVLFVICESVVIGLFWLFVYKIIILLVGKWFSWDVFMNVFFG